MVVIHRARNTLRGSRSFSCFIVRGSLPTFFVPCRQHIPVSCEAKHGVGQNRVSASPEVNGAVVVDGRKARVGDVLTILSHLCGIVNLLWGKIERKEVESNHKPLQVSSRFQRATGPLRRHLPQAESRGNDPQARRLHPLSRRGQRRPLVYSP